MGNQVKEETHNQIIIDEGNENNLDNQNNILNVESRTGDLPELTEYSGKTMTIKITAGAILGSLSIIIGFSWDAIVERVGGFSPSFAPGMTWLDFLAIPILVAFFMFGILSGLIAAIIGCGAIAFFPSEAFGWLSIWPKFFASVSMFFFPWLILKLLNKKESRKEKKFFKSFAYSSKTFQPLKNYAFLMGMAILGRAVVMFAVNTLVVAPLFFWLLKIPPSNTSFTSVFTHPTLYLSLGGGYAGWNLVQGLIDAVISYLIVYPTKLYQHYSVW